jgi:hypothetical protein
MIKPTVGRVVWYYKPGAQHTDQPYAALISYVHSDTCINVGGFDHNGKPFADTSVMLHQDEESYGNPGGGAWASWMPYQKSVASGEIPPTLHK